MAIGAEGGVKDGSKMPTKRVERPPGRNVPNASIVIRARRDDESAVRTEGRERAPARVPLEFGERLARGGVPHPGRLVETGGEYPRPVRTEHQGGDDVSVSFKFDE